MNTFEDFVREHKDWNHNWNQISQNIRISEKFMREFKDKLKWSKVSQYQKLSEAFIEEMADYVKWDKIAKYQDLSEEFKKKYAKKLKFKKEEESEYYDVKAAMKMIKRG